MKPKYLNSAAPVPIPESIDADHRAFRPTYLRQKSVTPASTAILAHRVAAPRCDSWDLAGRKRRLRHRNNSYGDVLLSQSLCAPIANATSEPVAIIIAWALPLASANHSRHSESLLYPVRHAPGRRGFGARTRAATDRPALNGGNPRYRRLHRIAKVAKHRGWANVAQARQVLDRLMGRAVPPDRWSRG